ncbi:uncharacterized protein LOC134265546 [Saccostrea cucullata]|uniref:uncharacterized protein LOC134265546 n=1 Tax=Saccostrea cuccullata TaxID=36930 RepID=UPI002ED3A437
MFNSAGFCQEICFSLNISIFAIKDNLCSCLKHLPEEGQVLPLFCNASCYEPGARIAEPYFEECGGNGTYSVFISGKRDERKPPFPGIFCVSIQCSATQNSFHFEEDCSKAYHPVCQLNGTEANVSESWRKSMQICK